jgi:hypothetical protein
MYVLVCNYRNFDTRQSVLFMLPSAVSYVTQWGKVTQAFSVTMGYSGRLFFLMFNFEISFRVDLWNFHGASYTGLLKMFVEALTTCDTQYTWDGSICIFLFNRKTLQVFVTYRTDGLLWFYIHQHDNGVRYKLFVACQRWWFQWRFAAILVNCAPSGELHNYCTPHIVKENFENIFIHRCNYILLSEVYCGWQIVKTPKIIFNSPVLVSRFVIKVDTSTRN